MFALITLSFLLIASLSIATLTASETRSSLSIDRSVVAFQIADAGIETILEKIYSNTCNGQRLDCLVSSPVSTCSVVNGAAGLGGDINSGSYRVVFYKSNGNPIDSCSTTSWRVDTESIQSEGVYNKTTRAVKVDVNPV